MRRPLELGAVEHLIGSFPLQVTHQDDGQESVPPGLVVQRLDRLDLHGGMESELIELQFGPGSRVDRDRRPTPSCRASGPLSCGPALGSSPPWEALFRRVLPWDGHG